jgi:phenylacetate-CoA ligase
MVDIGDKQAIFWGFSLDKPAGKRITEGIKNYFNNIQTLSTFDMSDGAMARYASRLHSYRPDYIVGYPSALTLFADYCKRTGTVVPRPKAVISSGERTFPHQREIMESVFGCPVFDRYGSREFACVAHECAVHRGLHVFSDLFFVEVVHETGRPAEVGEVGELVVTDLLNLYMPFIRYRTGDFAVPTDRTCGCGRGLPLLERIEGRAFDAIVTPSGKQVGGFFWTWLSRAVPGIHRFQVEQRRRGGVTLRIVPGPEWRNDYRSTLEARIKETCGENFHVTFQIIDDIPLTPSGKSKFIVSNLEERLVIKSKIHKATVTGTDPEGIDRLAVDEALMEHGNLAPHEKALVVDNTNGARVETVVVPAPRGSGSIVSGGGASRHIRKGDEVSIMAFTWSDDIEGAFSNILVDGDNRFVRRLIEKAGEKL